MNLPNNTTTDSRPTLSGDGIVGNLIEVYVDNILAGTTTVDISVKWKFKFSSPLASG